MPAPVSNDNLQAITDAIFRGAKIEAIKRYRESAGVGLAEAKTAVERLTEELRATSPEKFTSASARSGCTGVLAVGLFLAAGAAGWIVVRLV